MSFLYRPFEFLRMPFARLICLAALLVFSCVSKRAEKPVTSNLFEIGVELSTIHDDVLEEASGLVASVNNPNMLWTHNDSGDKARIFLIDKGGIVKTSVLIDSARNRDWEDIAIGPGPVEGKTYLYIGDIGDNESEFMFKYIYRIEEPVIDVKITRDTTIRTVAVIKFQYPDGLRDSESLMVDPLTRDLFLISKRELKANLYRLPYPQSTTSTILAELVVSQIEFDQSSSVDTTRLNGEALIRGYHPKYFYQIVAADISPDGTEVLVKSYSTVYYWQRQPAEAIGDLLKRPALVLPYKPEPQGEAIGFDITGNGYYTLNEKMRGKEQKLIFYKRH